MERLLSAEGIPLNTHAVAVDSKQDFLDPLGSSFVTFRCGEPVDVDTEELIIDCLCLFYKTYGILPKYVNDVDNRSMPEPNSYERKRFMLFTDEFLLRLKSCNEDEIERRTANFNELSFLTQLNFSGKFNAKITDSCFYPVEISNVADEEEEEFVFGVIKRVADSIEHTTSGMSSKKFESVFDYEAVLKEAATKSSTNEKMPLRCILLLLLMHQTKRAVLKSSEVKQLKLFCGIKEDDENVMKYLEDNFLVIRTDEKLDRETCVIVQPAISVSMLSHFFDNVADFLLKEENYPFCSPYGRYFDSNRKVLDGFQKTCAGVDKKEMDLIRDYMVNKGTFQRTLLHFQLVSKKNNPSTSDDCLASLNDRGGGKFEYCVADTATRREFIERDKLIFQYRRKADDSNFTITEEMFEAIKTKFFDNLTLKTPLNHDKAQSVMFFFDYGLTFLIARNVYKVETPLISLSICSFEEDNEDAYLYRRIASIASYTCNKVRETLEKSIGEVLPASEDLVKNYYFTNNEYVFPESPSQGFPPACLENWFPQNVSVKNCRSSRVLLLDGGGVKGIIEATTLMLINYAFYLHAREEKTDECLIDFIERQNCCCDFAATLSYPQIHELFDIVVGTSTGSLIATGLARNHDNPIQLMNKFIQSARDIFPNNYYQNILSMWKVVTNRPRYDETPLVNFISREFQTLPYKFPLLGIVAQKNSIFSSTGMKAALFDSRKQEDRILGHAVQASAAAPTYFRKKDIESDSYVDGGFGSNCPVKEGMRMTKDVAELEGEEYTNSDCTISLGCGYGDVIDTLPSFAFGWLTKSTNVLTDAQKNWEDFPDKGKIQIRLNPPRKFEVGKYDLADSLKTEQMAVDYLKKLTTRESCSDVGDVCEFSHDDNVRWCVTNLKVNNLSFKVASDKLFANSDEIKHVVLTFNKIIEEKTLSIRKKRILVDNGAVEIRVISSRTLELVRSSMHMLELDFRDHSSYEETMQIEVKTDEGLSCFNIKVCSELAFRKEIETTAACLFAKNVYVCEANRDDMIQVNHERIPTNDKDMFHLSLHFTCLSGHGCHVKSLTGNNTVNENRAVEREPRQMNDQLNIDCEACKNEPHTRRVKSTVFVEGLKMTHSGNSMEIVEVAEPSVVKTADGTTITCVQLVIEADRWPKHQKSDFQLAFEYMGFEISGSPITLNHLATHPSVLHRYYRKEISQRANINVSKWSLLCIDPTIDNHPRVSSIISASDLQQYARETRQALVLLSRCKTFDEWYVKTPDHVVNRNDASIVTRYMLAENVQGIEYLGLQRDPNDRPRYHLAFAGFLESLNHIEKYKDETADQLMRKLKGCQHKFEGRMRMFFGFPVLASEDPDSYAKVALVALSQIYNVKVVLQTFDYRKQQFYIRHRYHVITPRPKNFFNKVDSYDFSQPSGASDEEFTLNGVVFVNIKDVKSFKKKDVLKRFYSDPDTKSINFKPTITSLNDIRTSPNSNETTQEFLLRYVKESGNKVVFLSGNTSLGEYFLRKPCHVILPAEKVRETVYLDLSHERGLHEDIEDILINIKGQKPLQKVGMLEDFHSQLVTCDRYDLSFENMTSRLDQAFDENKKFHQSFFGDFEDHMEQIKLVLLSEVYQVKTVIQSYNERLDEYFIQWRHNVIRSWSSSDSDSLNGIIFINPNRDK